MVWMVCTTSARIKEYLSPREIESLLTPFMKIHLSVVVLTVGVLAAGALLAFYLHQEVKQEVLSQFSEAQLQIARQTVGQIDSYFDARTQDGADMSYYNGLIQKALASIEHTFRRRAATGLLSGRGGLLPTASETPDATNGQFELITWLVILKS